MFLYGKDGERKIMGTLNADELKVLPLILYIYFFSDDSSQFLVEGITKGGGRCYLD